MAVVENTGERWGIDVGGETLSLLRGEAYEPITLPSNVTCLDVPICAAVDSYGLPEAIVVVAAGPVGPDGCVKITNRPTMAEFDSTKLGAHLGCTIRVVNDMRGKGAGLKASGVSRATLFDHNNVNDDGQDLIVIGGNDDIRAATVGTYDHVVTVSSGVGNGEADRSSQGGHSTWAPANDLEYQVQRVIRGITGSRYVSVEDTIGGKHLYKLFRALKACDSAIPVEVNECIETLIQGNRDIGPTVTNLALGGDAFCGQMMQVFGSVLGQWFGNLAVFMMPRSINITGGAMKPEVVNFLFKETLLLQAFLDRATSNPWVRDVPIYRVEQERDLGVRGACRLAQELVLS